MDAERQGGTACLLPAQLGNLRTSWDRRVGGALRAVRRDDHVDLDAFTCIPGEDRRDRPFIIGVRPDGDERPGLAFTTRARSSDKTNPAITVQTMKRMCLLLTNSRRVYTPTRWRDDYPATRRCPPATLCVQLAGEDQQILGTVSARWPSDAPRFHRAMNCMNAASSSAIRAA